MDNCSIHLLVESLSNALRIHRNETDSYDTRLKKKNAEHRRLVEEHRVVTRQQDAALVELKNSIDTQKKRGSSSNQKLEKEITVRHLIST